MNMDKSTPGPVNPTEEIEDGTFEVRTDGTLAAYVSVFRSGESASEWWALAPGFVKPKFRAAETHWTFDSKLQHPHQISPSGWQDFVNEASTRLGIVGPAEFWVHSAVKVAV